MLRTFAIITALALGACGPTVTSSTARPVTATQATIMKQTVSQRLKDPGAATFRNLRRLERTHTDGSQSTLYCGEVNGKNAFGAYVGYRWFQGWFEGNSFVIQTIATAEMNDTVALPCI